MIRAPLFNAIAARGLLPHVHAVSHGARALE
jgi:hypothetical protein